MLKLFLLKDWAADGVEYESGQLFSTSDEDEAKDLLFKGIARLATSKDEQAAPTGAFKTPEELTAAVKAVVQSEVEGLKTEQKRMSDVLTAQTVKATPKDEDENKFKTFGEQIQAVVKAFTPGGEIDPRLLMKAPSGLSEGVSSDGGFLVQQEFAAELLRNVYETGILAPRCRKITLSGNKNGLKINGIDETNRATGSRWGGIRGYWKEEAGSKTSSSPKFRQVELDLKKMIGMCYATDELLQDTTALEQLLMQGFAEEFGFMLDDAIINGTGAGQPLGILNAVAKNQVSKETGQAAATIVTENIDKMYTRLWPRSINNAVWYINQNCWPQIFALHRSVGTGGYPMYQPPGALKDAPYGSLMGRPVQPIEQCQTLGTEGDIIFADLTQYMLIDKGGIQSDRSIHLRFNYDETTFRFVYRVDGQPLWNNKLTPYKGTTSYVSPFVTLEGRS